MDRNAFLIRYYRWACDDWEREISTDLSRISALPCSCLQSAAAVLARWPKDAQRRIAMALAKRFHPEACQLLEVSITPEEAALLQRVQAERLWEVPDWPRGKIDARGLRRLLRDAMTALTGVEPDPEYTLGVEWRHVQLKVGLRVLTYVDTGGRTRQVEYNHDLHEEDGSEVRRFISLAQWLGLGQTTFDCVQPGCEQQAVDQIVDLCGHFLQALPYLVTGRAEGSHHGAA